MSFLLRGGLIYISTVIKTKSANTIRSICVLKQLCPPPPPYARAVCKGGGRQNTRPPRAALAPGMPLNVVLSLIKDYITFKTQRVVE